MSHRQMMRSFRKEMLLLQAEQFRMALRQDLGGLSPEPAPGMPSGAWLEALASVLGAVLPGRWGRWLNLGMSAWKIGKRVLEKNDPPA